MDSPSRPESANRLWRPDLDRITKTRDGLRLPVPEVGDDDSPSGEACRGKCSNGRPFLPWHDQESKLELVAAKPRTPKAPKPPATLSRFVKTLLAVPAEEIAEQKATYEREKRQRRDQPSASPGPRSAA
jgi:hypothetical protein